MSQIVKLIGYTEIKVQGVVIPVKFGMQAFTYFCDHYGVELAEIIEKLFKWVKRREVDKDGNETEYDAIVPIKPFETASVMLWAGANYVNVFNGGSGFRVIEASNWIDELGGINSAELIPVYDAFWKAYKNGGTPPVESPFETEEQKKSEPVAES